MRNEDSAAISVSASAVEHHTWDEARRRRPSNLSLEAPHIDLNVIGQGLDRPNVPDRSRPVGGHEGKRLRYGCPALPGPGCQHLPGLPPATGGGRGRRSGVPAAGRRRVGVGCLAGGGTRGGRPRSPVGVPGRIPATAPLPRLPFRLSAGSLRASGPAGRGHDREDVRLRRVVCGGARLARVDDEARPRVLVDDSDHDGCLRGHLAAHAHPHRRAGRPLPGPRHAALSAPTTCWSRSIPKSAASTRATRRRDCACRVRCCCCSLPW